MTPRALARFQSFPDDYQLPPLKRLACKIIGNAVPPVMARAMLESVI
jgi:site-specific DNA-cytosine methylase